MPKNLAYVAVGHSSPYVPPLPQPSSIDAMPSPWFAFATIGFSPVDAVEVELPGGIAMLVEIFVYAARIRFRL